MKCGRDLTTAGIALLEAMDIFFSVNAFIPENWTKLECAGAFFAVCVGLFISTTFACTVRRYFQKVFELADLCGGHHLYVCFGDLFEAGELFQKDGFGSIVISVNRCFDTIVDDKLVSSSTIHGKFLKRLEEQHVSRRAVASCIQANLDDQVKIDATLKPTRLAEKEKPEGNRDRYPPGMTAIFDPKELGLMDSCRYFLFGLSRFDEHLTANTTEKEFQEAVCRMVEFFYNHSEGHPIALPLIGNGMSKTGIAPQQLFDYLVASVQLKKSRFSFDVYIVLTPNSRGQISVLR